MNLAAAPPQFDISNLSATQPPSGLSVAIITKDEASNLAATLRSVAWADEIVVVDSGSTDETQAIAESFGVRFVRREWPGFAHQKNHAISLCRHAWILSLDADEVVSQELASSIQQVVREEATAVAYSMNRRNYFMGRWIRHGGFYPDTKLRLFPRGAAAFGERDVHESMACRLPVTRLRGDLLHHAYPALAIYLEHMNRYSSLAAAEALRRGKKSRFARDVLARPVATFLSKYLLRAGFLDGVEGLLLNLFHAYYVSWKYAKIWDGARRPQEAEHPGPLPDEKLDAGVFPG